MSKITFMGAGSTVFAKNVLGDTMLAPALRDAHIALYDIDGGRLKDSKLMLDTLNGNINQGRATISAHLGAENRRAALDGASYVVNAIQVGGYEPGTVIDFEVPRKYGLRQTIGDTLGIGGIFRGLRTIPVVLDFARDMEAVCPDAWFLNYTNPMCMVTGALLQATPIRTVGLCHSVQVCARELLWALDVAPPERLQWKIAGINHQGWLLEISDDGHDLYPMLKRRAADRLARVRANGGRGVLEGAREKLGKDWRQDAEARVAVDMVRLTMMLQVGYYLTESSEHTAEYLPHWIKRTHPDLIDEFNIPLDEYLRRCVKQIEGWNRRREEIVTNRQLAHSRTHEYGSYIMEAMETDVPTRIAGNVMNDDLITNLPRKACVEVACLVDGNGVQPTALGDLPEPCAAINRTGINVQLLAIEAALERRRERIYQAAMMDPHTAAELSLDEIRDLCDDLIEAHGEMLPTFR